VNFEEKYVKDLGNAVITPGFIDLLTQYQYTDILEKKSKDFKSKLKKFFKMLTLKYIFAGVRSDNYSRKWAGILSNYFSLDRMDKINSFKHGVINSIMSGTTCIAQVSKEYKYFEIINKLPIKNYLFFEVFADSKDSSKKTFKNLRNKIEELIWHKGENTHIGVMLNSISGVHRKLWALFSKYCRKHNMLMMTRFAESQDEIEWLEYGFSDIDLLHKFMGMRKISPYSTEITPVEYLDNLKVLTKKVLIANANYDTSELDKLAQTGVKYIYQPLYSEEICNSRLDFETVLNNFKENFGFSTQSFANNRSFSLLKLANDMNKDNLLDIVELIKYLTLYPARILRLDNSIGSIEVGKDADFNVFKLADGEDYRALSHLETPYSVYSKGRKLIKNGNIRFSL
jgi:cytosine/adenosine deaminase-related metal-dependent hydrolase